MIRNVAELRSATSSTSHSPLVNTKAWLSLLSTPPLEDLAVAAASERGGATYECALYGQRTNQLLRDAFCKGKCLKDGGGGKRRVNEGSGG